MRRSLYPPLFRSTGTGGLLHTGLKGPALKLRFRFAHEEKLAGDKDGMRVGESGIQCLGQGGMTGMRRRARG